MTAVLLRIHIHIIVYNVCLYNLQADSPLFLFPGDNPHYLQASIKNKTIL